MDLIQILSNLYKLHLKEISVKNVIFCTYMKGMWSRGVYAPNEIRNSMFLFLRYLFCLNCNFIKSLYDITVCANITKTKIFHHMKFDLKGH